MKRDLYEGGIRVPMIAWWPGTIEPGTQSEHISGFWDVLPTLCEIGGADIQEDIDGISFLPELKGQEQNKHDFLYWEFHEEGKKQAVRKGKWKAVRINVYENPDAPIELYDLSIDINESENIAENNPEIVAEMEAIMEKAHTPDPNWPLFKTEE